MARIKGSQKTGGRQKGSTNKRTQELTDMIDGALNAVGGQQYLEQQALNNPVAFMSLIAKRLPRDIVAKVDGNINITNIVRTIIDPNDNS